MSSFPELFTPFRLGCDTALTLPSKGVRDITLLQMTDTFAGGQEATHQLLTSPS